MSFLSFFSLKRMQTFMRFYYFVLAVLLFISIYIDVAHIVPFVSDLRNRVVGARMIKDGLSPYFYVWKEGAPDRYYMYMLAHANVSPCTATPFFHYIFSLIADLPQSQMNILWFIIEYLTLASCLIFAVFFVDAGQRKKALPLFALIVVTFTYTVGWRIHVAWGQNYIFLPALALICFGLLKRKFNFINAFLFAIAATAMILIRPISGLIFIPLIFNPKQYLKWSGGVVLTLLVYITFAFINPVQKRNWVDYFHSIKIHAENHQYFWYVKRELRTADKKANPKLEGEDLNWTNNHEFAQVFEIASLFALYYDATGNKLSVNEMESIGVGICLVLLLPMIILGYKRIGVSLIPMLLLGFCMYDIFSYCQPIIRGEYNRVELIFPLLLLAIFLKKIHIIPFLMLIIGILFNIFPLFFTFIKVRQALGEFMILACFLFFVYRPLLVSYFSQEKLKINETIYWL